MAHRDKPKRGQRAATNKKSTKGNAGKKSRKKKGSTFE